MRPVPLYPFPSRARQAITSFDILVVSNVSSVFGFANVIIGIWFAVRTSARHSSRSTFDPPPAYVTILIYCIPTPYTLFSSVFSVFSFFFLNHLTVYTSPICIFLLRGQPTIITFLYPYFSGIFLPFLFGPLSLCDLLFLSSLKQITAYTSPTCIFFLRGQPIIMTFLCPYFFRVFGFSFRLYFWLLRILSSFLSSTV